jgi:hypothetical protein
MPSIKPAMTKYAIITLKNVINDVRIEGEGVLDANALRIKIITIVAGLEGGCADGVGDHPGCSGLHPPEAIVDALNTQLDDGEKLTKTEFESWIVQSNLLVDRKVLCAAKAFIA